MKDSTENNTVQRTGEKTILKRNKILISKGERERECREKRVDDGVRVCVYV